MVYNPKVSIVIPAFNASNYLGQAIDYALNQTYENIEIIVVNDGSKDDGKTRAVAEKYKDKIIYIEKENGGSSSALNEGIRAMSGEWFSWLSHDDLYKPNKIKKQIDYLSTLLGDVLYKNVICAEAEFINANGKVIRTPKQKNVDLMAQKVNGLNGANGKLIAEPTVYNFHGCSLLVNKKVYEEIGVFDESLRLLNDIDMWFRIYSYGYKIHYIPEVLVQGRVHEKQVSRAIGFSYHNPEQDMFWARSLKYLQENFTNDFSLFYLFGANAYLKTRNDDGDNAFNFALSIKPEKAKFLKRKKRKLTRKAKFRSFLKKVYLKFFVR